MELLQPSWKGKNLQTRKIGGNKYVAMIGSDAMLYIPVNVLPNAIYRLRFELYKESGNGIVLCNIYGNRNFDFPASTIDCNKEIWATYEVDVVTRSFPETIPLIFRIWRGKKGTGTIFVKRLFVELVEGEIKPQNKGQIVSVEKTSEATKPPVLKMPRSNKPRRVQKKKGPRRVSKVATRRVARPAGPHRVTSQSKPPMPLPGTTPPKVGPLKPGEDGIKNSVIISMKNRKDFLDRTLYTYDNQTMPKSEFEIVIIDDGSEQDLLSVCKKHSELSGLQFQFIRVDSRKGAVPQRGWTPALTNNIGFKKARGAVHIITGPETLQKETNMEKTWEVCNGPKCVYGVVHKSHVGFVNMLRKDKGWHENKTFTDLLRRSGHTFMKPAIRGFWWYYAAARREYIMAIKGVDEKYMGGMCGEDDDFAARMIFLGLRLMHDFEILGIHQNHSREDKCDNHSIRFDSVTWQRLRTHNRALLEGCKNAKRPEANRGINWGAEEAIIDMEIF